MGSGGGVAGPGRWGTELAGEVGGAFGCPRPVLALAGTTAGIAGALAGDAGRVIDADGAGSAWRTLPADVRDVGGAGMLGSAVAAAVPFGDAAGLYALTPK